MNKEKRETYIGLESGVHTKEYDWPDKLSHKELLVEAFGDIGAVDFIRDLVTLGQPYITLIVQILRIESVRIVVLAIGLFCVNHIISLCSLCRRLVRLIRCQI